MPLLSPTGHTDGLQASRVGGPMLDALRPPASVHPGVIVFCEQGSPATESGWRAPSAMPTARPRARPSRREAAGGGGVGTQRRRTPADTPLFPLRYTTIFHTLRPQTTPHPCRREIGKSGVLHRRQAALRRHPTPRPASSVYDGGNPRGSPSLLRLVPRKTPNPFSPWPTVREWGRRARTGWWCWCNE